MRLVSHECDNSLLVRVGEDRIDAASAVDFKDGMRALVTPAVRRVVLDMTDVDAIDSSGLGAIVSVMKFMGSDRRLELAALSEKVFTVFRLTRMDQVITIHAHVDDALTETARAS